MQNSYNLLFTNNSVNMDFLDDNLNLFANKEQHIQKTDSVQNLNLYESLADLALVNGGGSHGQNTVINKLDKIF